MEKIFKKRLNKEIDVLKAQYFNVYEDTKKNHEQFNHLLSLIEEHYNNRNEILRVKDMKKSDWHLSRNIVGMMLYVDLFAGDFTKLKKKIPYLKELGITLVHLMPLLKPREGENDGGYAVEDFKDVDPKLGTLKEFDDVLVAFNKAGIEVCIDFVMNHVADTHVWAQKALQGDKAYMDLFEMYDDRTIPDLYDRTVPEVLPDKCPGNFTYKSEINKWVFTSFSSFQWDLNFKNPKVLELIIDVLLHLSNQGISMIRLDAIPFIWKTLNTQCRNLDKAHQLISILHTIKRIVCPSLVLLGEAIVEPHEIYKYFGDSVPESDVLYNANLMVNVWNAFAARDTRLLYEDNRRYDAPRGTCWMNYVRCHDDIGWGFNEDAIWSYSMNPFDHKQFLINYYSGNFEGSFAKGERYQYNPVTEDARTNGTLASLLGVEIALDAKDPYALEVSLRRINLAHGLIIAQNGIPLIYSGDEIGTINDYSYLNDPDKLDEGRWVHRPFFNWSKARKRNKVETVEGNVFLHTKELIRLRKLHLEFDADAYTHYLQFANTKVYAFYKEKNNQKIICLFNFSEDNQYVDNYEFIATGTNYMTKDIITGKMVDLNHSNIHLHPYEMLWLKKD